MAGRLAALLLASLLLLVGCNSRDLPPPPGEPPPPPRPKPGSTPLPYRAEVVVAGRGDVAVLDPAYQPDDAEADVIVNVYDGLVELDPQLQLAPALATSWKQVQPTVWEFSLRRGVAFSDGEPFEARTVARWFQRLRTIRERGLGASSLELLPTLVDVKQVDRSTVQLVTGSPDPILPRRLAQPGAYITPTGPFEHDDGDPKVLWDRPIGTGPYMVRELVGGQRLTLVPNTNYWGNPVKAKEVGVRVMPDPASRAAALKLGLVDLALDLPVDAMDDLRLNAGVEVPPVRAADRLAWLRFDAVDPGPLADPRVRRAVAGAIDRQAIVDAVLGGLAVPADGLVTPEAAGACPVAPYAYDPAGSKALLEQAGAAQAVLDLAYASDRSAEVERVALAIAADLGAVGVQARPVPMAGDALAAAVRAHALTGMWLDTLANPTLDAGALLAQLLPAGPLGWAAPLGGEAADLTTRLQSEPDQGRRAAMACRVQQLERDAAPGVPLWQETLRHGFNPKLVRWTAAGDGRLHVDRLTLLPKPTPVPVGRPAATGR
jgi:peptide/nickel transport system substrate-binding protein